MKTLIIYTDIESPLRYLIVDGDFSRFNGVMVNSINGNGYEDEFCEWMWDSETGNDKYDWSNDITLIENKNWDRVAIVTFIP